MHQMSPSKRIRITLGNRSYEQLVHLADLADQSVAVEARLLLTWGIDLALRRWAELSGTSAEPALHVVEPTVYAPPKLPMHDLTQAETDRAMREIRRQAREMTVDEDPAEPPRPFPPDR